MNYIDETRNDSFQELGKSDIEGLINQIENYYLSYRASLNLGESVTFGIEIEYEKLSKRVIDRFVSKKVSNWKSTTDSSLISGGEVISPILTDRKQTWSEIKLICQKLKNRHANADINAGAHIHIGASILGENREYWLQFMKVYAAYESILLRFFYGDKVNARKNIWQYAPPTADAIYCQLLKSYKYTDTKEMLKNGYLLSEKYNALSFVHINIFDLADKYGDNTVEFRASNGTLNEVIWQNNINTAAKLMTAPTKGLIDEEFLDYKLENNRISATELNMYNRINLPLALELVDMIFDNNLDKVYFLRQYLKNYQEISRDPCHAVKAKRFTLR